MIALAPHSPRLIAQQNDEVRIHPYQDFFAPVVAATISQEQFWGVVPQELVLGRVLYVQSISGGTAEQRAAYQYGDYVVSKIESKYDESRLVISMDFVAKNDLRHSLPNTNDNKNGLAAFTTSFDVRRESAAHTAKDVILTAHLLDEMVLSEDRASTVPALCSQRLLYPPMGQGRIKLVDPPKSSRNIINAVRMAWQGTVLVCQAKTATRKWETMRDIQRRPKPIRCDA